MGFWMTAARGIDRGFQPGFASRSGAGGLPGLMIAVLAVGSGVVEPFCARLRHRQLPFGALDSESDPSDEPIKTRDDRLPRMQTIIQRKQGYFRKAIIIASSPVLRTEEDGAVGPVAASPVVVRRLHLASEGERSCFRRLAWEFVGILFLSDKGTAVSNYRTEEG
jgi:hypothetical protein